MIRLYDYYRSSASYRVRIALAMKEIEYELVSVDLAGGAQKEQPYRAENPQGAVPYFVDDDVRIGQSLAIMEYLDEKYPQNPLIFGNAQDRAYIRQMALLVACDIHPLNNLKVWKGYVGKVLGAGEKQSQDWYAHWIHEGFTAYEALLEKQGMAGDFTCNDQPSMADLCLIPQIYNARRFNVDLSNYPRICAIEKNCMAMDSFQKAAPEAHRDAPDGLEVIHGPDAPFLTAA